MVETKIASGKMRFSSNVLRHAHDLEQEQDRRKSFKARIERLPAAEAQALELPLAEGGSEAYSPQRRRRLMGFMEVLRRATEEDVDRALEDAPFDLPPQDEAQLLDFFNRMLDLMVMDGLGTDE